MWVAWVAGDGARPASSKIAMLYPARASPARALGASVAKRHGADGTATAAGAAVYDFDANGHRRAKNLIGIN